MGHLSWDVPIGHSRSVKRFGLKDLPGELGKLTNGSDDDKEGVLGKIRFLRATCRKKELARRQRLARRLGHHPRSFSARGGGASQHASGGGAQHEGEARNRTGIGRNR